MRDLQDKLAVEIAFSLAKGIHGPVMLELLERIGGVREFFELDSASLHNLTGFSTEIFKDSYRDELLRQGEKEAAIVREKHLDAMFKGNDDYPYRLLNCDDSPTMLYRFGNCNLDRRHCVGVVGTRHATAYGVEFTSRLVQQLSEKLDDLIIVSGLAYGIDVAAHKASIAAGVPTVGVVAHGLSRIYPAEHRQVAARMTALGGALVTEYTYQTGPLRQSFLARNRIIAGLCDCVIVVESDVRGGALSTARIARQYDREVFAVPGRVTDRYSQGTNKLISNHTAALIEGADDVIALMGWENKGDAAVEAPQLFRPFTEQEQEFIDFITQNPDATINDICVRLGCSFSTLSNVIFQLEIDDIIRTTAGGRYELITPL